MLSPDPVFAPIDYKEVLEQFYRRVPREFVFNVYRYDHKNIEKIERLLQEADFEFLFQENFYNERIKIINKNIPEHKNLFEEFGSELDIYFTKDGLTIPPLDLFRLFLSFSNDKGTKGYRFLFYFFRVTYAIIESRSFLRWLIKGWSLR